MVRMPTAILFIVLSSSILFPVRPLIAISIDTIKAGVPQAPAQIHGKMFKMKHGPRLYEYNILLVKYVIIENYLKN